MFGHMFAEVGVLALAMCPRADGVESAKKVGRFQAYQSVVLGIYVSIIHFVQQYALARADYAHFRSENVEGSKASNDCYVSAV